MDIDCPNSDESYDLAYKAPFPKKNKMQWKKGKKKKTQAEKE